MIYIKQIFVAVVSPASLNSLYWKKNQMEEPIKKGDSPGIKNKRLAKERSEEIIENKKNEEGQYKYHLQVLKNIDSALHNAALAQKFITNGEINLKPIAPDGLLSHDLNDVAWQVAKQNNIFSKMDLSTYGLLTNIYNNQDRITKS